MTFIYWYDIYCFHYCRVHDMHLLLGGPSGCDVVYAGPRGPAGSPPSLIFIAVYCTRIMAWVNKTDLYWPSTSHAFTLFFSCFLFPGKPYHQEEVLARVVSLVTRQTSSLSHLLLTTSPTNEPMCLALSALCILSAIWADCDHDYYDMWELDAIKTFIFQITS